MIEVCEAQIEKYYNAAKRNGTIRTIRAMMRTRSANSWLITLIVFLALQFPPLSLAEDSYALAEQLIQSVGKVTLKKTILMYCDGEITIDRNNMIHLAMGSVDDEFITADTVARDINRCGHGKNGFLAGLEREAAKAQSRQKFQERFDSGEVALVESRGSTGLEQRTSEFVQGLREEIAEIESRQVIDQANAIRRKEEEQRENRNKLDALEREFKQEQKEQAELAKQRECRKAIADYKENMRLADSYVTPSYRTYNRRKSEENMDFLRQNCKYSLNDLKY